MIDRPGEDESKDASGQAFRETDSQHDLNDLYSDLFPGSQAGEWKQPEKKANASAAAAKQDHSIPAQRPMRY